jgi:hypothetical protein
MNQLKKMSSCILVSILLILYPPRSILDLGEKSDFSLEIHYPKKKLFDLII